MTIRQTVARYFLKSLPKEELATEKDLTTEETAWSEYSAIYSNKDFEKYNPDSLIGTNGFGIYKRMMKDEQVKAVTRFKRDAITSRGYIFELDHEKYGITEEEAERRIDISYKYIDKLKGSWTDVLNGIMSASQYGFSMTEKIHTQFQYEGLTYWGIDKLKLKPFDTFTFSVDEFSNIVKVIQKLGSKEQYIDLNRFIHFVVNPDIDEHYGGSELREAHRSWWSKDIMIKFQNMWGERHAGGLRWIQPKEGSSIAQGSALYNALQTFLSNINVGTGGILPGNVEFNQEYPNNNVPYKSMIDGYDVAIARALLVPNLLGMTPQEGTGALAQSDNHLKTFFWTLKADSNRLEDILNEQLFRPLGEVNFGDDAWPRYKMKPESDEKIDKLINTWKELVNAKAVTATDTDEAKLRELLEMPEPGEPINSQPSPIPVLPGDTNNPEDGTNPEGDSTEDSPEEDNPEELKKKKDETVRGKGNVKVSAFSKALRRVDFAVIAKTSDSIVDEFTRKSAEMMDTIVADLLNKAKEAGPVTEEATSNVKALKVDSKMKRSLEGIQKRMLKESFSIGIKHASYEVDKAKKTAYSRKVDMQRIDMISDDYFKLKAFKITGDLTDEAVRIIEAEIINGAKLGKSWVEIEKAIYSTFATKGMITIEQAKDALGEALNVNSPDARLRTITRTSTFDAINEARFSYFTDPGLGGFVTAFEYSAILDDRTTAICRHLDEENRGNHSAGWYESNPQFKPPNHYNCRSLLVPVTEVDQDSFIEGDEPTMQPQDGFR